MKMLAGVLTIACIIALPPPARAQVDVQPSPSQSQFLTSADPRLAANKRLVFDFWREVLEAGHMDLAPKYMLESYVQHNPNVPTGRAAFVDFFSKVSKPKPIEPTIKAPLVAIVAERDLVVLSFVRKAADPKDKTKTYTTTWFDMFRVDKGKVAEHWDCDSR